MNRTNALCLLLIFLLCVPCCVSLATAAQSTTTFVQPSGNRYYQCQHRPQHTTTAALSSSFLDTSMSVEEVHLSSTPTSVLFMKHSTDNNTPSTENAVLHAYDTNAMEHRWNVTWTTQAIGIVAIGGGSQSTRALNGVAAPVGYMSRTMSLPSSTDASLISDTGTFAIGSSGQMTRLYIANSGKLVQVFPNGTHHPVPLHLPAHSTDYASNTTVSDSPNVLLDGRIVHSDRNGMFAMYTRASSSRYAHGVLGDSTEGASVAILTTKNDTSDPATIVFTSLMQLSAGPVADSVFEGIAPMWADMDCDGIDELITTVADSEGGARIRVHHFTLENSGVNSQRRKSCDGHGPILQGAHLQFSGVTDGVKIGQRNRWQHQLAVAPFGPGREVELVETVTPHIGGRLRYYRLVRAPDSPPKLVVVAESNGDYTTHYIGSRNLDMAVALDVDGDGQAELLVQSRYRNKLILVRRGADRSVHEAHSLSTGTEAITNFAPTCFMVSVDATNAVMVHAVAVGMKDKLQILYYRANMTKTTNGTISPPPPPVSDCVTPVENDGVCSTLAASSSTFTVMPTISMVIVLVSHVLLFV